MVMVETRSSAAAEIALVSGRYAVQSFKITNICTNRKPVCYFLSELYELTSYLVPLPSYRAVLVILSLMTCSASM